MKKYWYMFGVFALALALSGMPTAALAESDGEEGGAQAQRVQEAAREGQKQEAEVAREQEKQRLETSTSSRPSIRGDREDDDFDLEEDEDDEQALSDDDLNRRIQVRKHELDDEEASTTPETRRNIVKNANPVRLAVHSLLASRDILDTKGGIGQQVSEIAKEVNRSVASTTDAEVKIQSRGFFSRFLFGGDKTAAEVIAQEASQNQARIEKLGELLTQASTTEAVKATLSEQIAALKEAQTRIQALADKEKSAWGLFSWRF